MRRDLIVVTGAGGFIGGHMARRLAHDGARIRAVDIKPVEQWHQVVAGADNLQLDLRRAEACDEALREAGTVYNLAADMGGMGFIETNKALCMLSVLINTHLLESAARTRCGRVLLLPPRRACTPPDKQLEPNVRPLKESDAYPAMPEDGYGWEKLFSERMCRHFTRGLRPDHPRRPLPQRLRPARHLGRRPGEGAGGDLPEGGRGAAVGQSRDRDLGRRRADAQLHVHRRLHRRHAADHGQRHRRADQPRQRASWSPSTSSSTSSRTSRE